MLHRAGSQRSWIDALALSLATYRTSGITLDVTERFKDRLVEEGFNPSYGARPLRRAITRLVEDAMAENMLGGEIKDGDSIIMDVDANGEIALLNGDKKMTTKVAAQSGIA